MFRRQDLSILNRFYNRKENDFIIVCGNKRTNVSDLINNFIKDKEYFYYKAASVDWSSQKIFLQNELKNHIRSTRYTELSFEDQISALLAESTDKKKLFIFDDFTNLISEDSNFVNLLFSIVFNNEYEHYCTIILITSDIYFVKNNLFKVFKKQAYNFSAIMDLSSYHLDDLLDISELSINDKQLLQYFSTIGADSLFWDHVNINYDYQSFLINAFSNHNIFISEGYSILPSKLRTSKIYNTILYNIAIGKEKLYELHEATLIDRAKLLVYIKALISYDIIEKSDSIIIGNENNIKKGLYKIKDPYVRFWYYYVFPNSSALTVNSAEKFYKKYIESTINDFSMYYFGEFCYSYYLNYKNKKFLSDNNFRYNNYNDKNELIDFILTGENDRCYICSCSKYNQLFTLENYNNLLYVLRKNHIEYEGIIIFSTNGYESKLREAENDKLELITISLY